MTAAGSIAMIPRRPRRPGATARSRARRGSPRCARRARAAAGTRPGRPSGNRISGRSPARKARASICRCRSCGCSTAEAMSRTSPRVSPASCSRCRHNADGRLAICRSMTSSSRSCYADGPQWWRTGHRPAICSSRNWERVSCSGHRPALRKPAPACHRQPRDRGRSAIAAVADRPALRGVIAGEAVGPGLLRPGQNPPPSTQEYGS
jgi:hypothetical protein